MRLQQVLLSFVDNAELSVIASMMIPLLRLIPLSLCQPRFVSLQVSLLGSMGLK